jgi:hypothetical protein
LLGVLTNGLLVAHYHVKVSTTRNIICETGNGKIKTFFFGSFQPAARAKPSMDMEGQLISSGGGHPMLELLLPKAGLPLRENAIGRYTWPTTKY